MEGRVLGGVVRGMVKEGGWVVGALWWVGMVGCLHASGGVHREPWVCWYW